MIAAQPVEIIPVAHLVLHLILLGLPWPYPPPAAVPVYLTGYYIAHSTVFNPVYGLYIIGLVPPLQPDNNIELFALCLFCAFQNFPDPRHIYCHRLFHKHVPALLYRLFKMDGPEAGRRNQQHHIGIPDGPLVPVKTYITTAFGHIYFIPELILKGLVRII